MPATLSEANRDVRDGLGVDVYLLVDDESAHLLSDPVMTAIAAQVLAVFLEGLRAAARGEVERWSRSAGSWLAARIKSVVRNGSAVGDEAEKLAETKIDLSAAERDAVERYAALSEPVPVALLRDQGFSAARAEQVAARSRAAGLAALDLS